MPPEAAQHPTVRRPPELGLALAGGLALLDMGALAGRRPAGLAPVGEAPSSAPRFLGGRR